MQDDIPGDLPELAGVFPALTTPFDAHGAIATGPLQDNLERYLEAGVHGFLVLGSTGESVLIDEAERGLVLDAARAAIPRSRTLVAGVSAESTPAAVRQACRAADAGADAVLVSTPHYYRGQMDAAALTSHYRRVADASPLPVLLYNVPKFTGVALAPALVEDLARHGNVVGIKDSSGDLGGLVALLARAPRAFRVLCGDAGVFHAALAAGASGAMLAAAAAFPEPMVRIAAAVRGGDVDGAVALHRAVTPACRLVAAELGVPGIKAALDHRGWYGGPPRAPLRPLPEAERVRVREAVDMLGEDRLIPA